MDITAEGAILALSFYFIIVFAVVGVKCCKRANRAPIQPIVQANVSIVAPSSSVPAVAINIGPQNSLSPIQVTQPANVILVIEQPNNDIVLGKTTWRPWMEVESRS